LASATPLSKKVSQGSAFAYINEIVAYFTLAVEL